MHATYIAESNGVRDKWNTAVNLNYGEKEIGRMLKVLGVRCKKCCRCN